MVAKTLLACRETLSWRCGVLRTAYGCFMTPWWSKACHLWIGCQLWGKVLATPSKLLGGSRLTKIPSILSHQALFFCLENLVAQNWPIPTPTILFLPSFLFRSKYNCIDLVSNKDLNPFLSLQTTYRAVLSHHSTIPSPLWWFLNDILWASCADCENLLSILLACPW